MSKYSADAYKARNGLAQPTPSPLTTGKYGATTHKASPYSYRPTREVYFVSPSVPEFVHIMEEYFRFDERVNIHVMTMEETVQHCIQEQTDLLIINHCPIPLLDAIDTEIPELYRPRILHHIITSAIPEYLPRCHPRDDIEVLPCTISTLAHAILRVLEFGYQRKPIYR